MDDLILKHSFCMWAFMCPSATLSRILFLRKASEIPISNFPRILGFLAIPTLPRTKQLYRSSSVSPPSHLPALCNPTLSSDWKELSVPLFPSLLLALGIVVGNWPARQGNNLCHQHSELC